ncbi:MAG TPA: NAD(P)/FAD-dependent oxidoreductase [Methanolinea sp.]|nr:NAD(P)/FAD-dependent oxidoreductase [Methanolinea sp.]HQK55855.1 NAD(P)/FAD-dependent oxidoreductase [Methanolinea sp.]
MRICIIGGGLTGLTAAYHLGRKHEVDLYEKRSCLGGCISSYEIGDYRIEEFYHHCFAGDSRLFSLMDSLRIADRLEWLRGTSGYYADGTVYPLNSPGEILRYPLLTIPDKIRLALLTMRARKMDSTPLDRITARDFVVREVGERVYRSFFEPLLTSKFGDRRDDISAAWLVSRIAIRSNRGLSGERLGYLKGGFFTLIEALSDEVGRHCVIRLQDPATSLSREPYGWRVNGQRYDAVISTIPPHTVPGGVLSDLPGIPYQGAACMLISLDHDVTSGIYWLNMKDPAPYGAVVAHTNFVPLERYGEHLVYLASYFQDTLPPRKDQAMLDDFCQRFHVQPDHIRWHRMAVEQSAGPLYSTGFRERVLPYQEKGLFLAGMFSRPNYPERSMEGAVCAGEEVAALLTREERA